MTVQEYILQSVSNLKKPEVFLADQEPLVEEISRLVLSKKFRKYSANEELIKHIKNAIRLKVEKNEPINITFLQGAYKLWRLEEAPEADWAELFVATYYTNWVKDICTIYQPGVWFDYFVDDLIVPMIDNLSLDEINAYVDSFQQVLDFLKSHQPQNLKMTITRVGDQFESPEAFYASVEKNAEKVRQTNPSFTEEQLRVVELNARPTAEQLKDPQWREKVNIIHDGYMLTKREPGYHHRPDKILAFTQPLPSGSTVSVGTAKTSIAKHWVGVGALKKLGKGYREYIFSPTQLQKREFIKETLEIDGLPGKNFQSIRVFS